MQSRFKLELRFDSPIPQVIESDAGRLRQILLNLLSNAIKFTNGGSVRLGLSFQGTAMSSSGQLIISVVDSGIGIAPEQHDSLFQPFSQADSSITRRFGGTGLGLHLSKRLAQALGGNLHLAWSVPLHGSCFVLSVPFEPAHKTEFIGQTEEIVCGGPDTCPLPMESIKDVRVLLVEDSLDNQTLMKIYLSREKAIVDIANNGLEAIDRALHNDYDIVLMDIAMPCLDGLEATRRLRALGYKKPILALTAHAMVEEVKKSLRAGCDAHLAKPVDRWNLVQGIRQHVSAQRQALSPN